ncbi:hypothetical protein [Aeoliella sp.]|uniref:hypothetical protein n=1 Tax=Aeoliella sp. TaxID=2795800 RepID=UPI003CCC0B41
MSQSPLQAAYETFLGTHDEHELLAAVELHGGIAPPQEADCPLAHRIHDIELCGSWYRVVRVVTLPEGNSDLLIYATDTPGKSAGVPYSLTGEGLLRWVHDELNEPTEGKTNWSKYLPRK